MAERPVIIQVGDLLNEIRDQHDFTHTGSSSAYGLVWGVRWPNPRLWVLDQGEFRTIGKDEWDRLTDGAAPPWPWSEDGVLMDVPAGPQA